jgi:hypothetical protein
MSNSTISRASRVALLACAAACFHRARSPVPVAAEEGVEFALRLGQTGDVTGTPVRVTFRRIEGDSRCPTDVTCIWAGDAAAIMTISSAGDFTDTLHLNGERKEVKHGAYIIRFLGLKPARVSTVKVDSGKYVGTFIVTK